MKEILLTEEMIKNSVLNNGNPYRILKIFEKLKRGEEITYVALGGSITEGAWASSPEFRYANLLVKWMKEKFPSGKVNFVNAGIGCTGSIVGVHRLDRDVLCYNPDFVTVEYSVNEREGDTTVEFYDNLVNNILNHPSLPAVLCVGLTCGNRVTAQNSHIKIAKHYDLPYISYHNAVWPRIERGEFEFKDLTPDDVHPNNTGHALVAGLVTDYFENIINKKSKEYVDIICDKPIVNNKYRNAKIYLLNDITPQNYGCFEEEETKIRTAPYGWAAHENGEPLEFLIKNCIAVHLLYRRTVGGGKAVAEVCGKQLEINSDFQCSDFSYYENALVYSSDKSQDVVLTITPKLEKDKVFTVCGIMVAY